MTEERTLTTSLFQNLHKEMVWKHIRSVPHGVVDSWRMIGDEYHDRLEVEWKRRGFSAEEHVYDFGEDSR